jgi:hypothetical protein
MEPETALACDTSAVQDAVAYALRAAPGGGGDWSVTVRERTGDHVATFTLGSYSQVLAFAERVQPLGLLMTLDEHRASHYDFHFDRRAANELVVDHPLRRLDDR